MNLNGPEVMQESERKKFLVKGEACMSIFWPAPGFNGKTSYLSGFSTEKTLISASAVSHCWSTTKEQKQKNNNKNFASDLMCDRSVFKHKHLIITVAPAC